MKAERRNEAGGLIGHIDSAAAFELPQMLDTRSAVSKFQLSFVQPEETRLVNRAGGTAPAPHYPLNIGHIDFAAFGFIKNTLRHWRDADGELDDGHTSCAMQ